uniref:Glutamate rich 1 n=1 Tax=Sphenodon punctatus TaxID=8508 RepID=A0A8D0GJJ5_SPHPU
MALSRKEVFIKKVVKRIFPVTHSPPHVHVSRGLEERIVRSPDSKPEQKASETVEGSSECTSSSGNRSEILPPRKLYTVSLPPDDYAPVTYGDTNSRKSESSEDAAEEDCQGQPKKRRIRRKKQKNTLQTPDNLHGEQTDSGKHENLIQDNIQLQCTDGPKLSKNKKRKMKKKRQKEKMRAAGMLTKTTGLDFTYQPEKGSSKEGVDFEDVDKKADGILDFLQATQEMYLSDSKSKCADSAVSLEAAQKIFQHLESRSMSSSDMTLLHQLKSFVLLQDVERLKGGLEEFQEYSMMPPGMYSLIIILTNVVLNVD